MKKQKELKLMFVVASRPNFMKIAPLVKEAQKQKIKFSIFYTEQHKSELMSKVFFKELEIPKPDFNLNLKNKSKKNTKFSKGMRFILSIPRTISILKKDNPNIVIVVGDVISSSYVASISRLLRIPIAHVEAGLRSFNNKMPEEKSRKIIDKFSGLLFTTEKAANQNLLKEGKSQNKIFFVGNIMIDSLINKIGEAKKINYYKKLKLKDKSYVVLTFHRHENINNKKRLLNILDVVNKISKKIKIILPLHPSTKKQLIRFNLLNKLNSIKNLKIINPISYNEMLSLVLNSKFVMTDSGGIQEETTFMKIPCLTLRTETERPVTVDVGTNTIVGFGIKKIEENVEKILNGTYKKGKIPELWDGKTAERIIKILSSEKNI